MSMTITKDELRKLSQSAFFGPTSNLSEPTNIVCAECGVAIPREAMYYAATRGGEPWSGSRTICPACYAKHPGGETWPKFWLGIASGVYRQESAGTVIQFLPDGKDDARDTGHVDPPGDLCTELVARARAAARHSPWPWPEPEDEGDGWEYGISGVDVMRFRGDGDDYEYVSESHRWKWRTGSCGSRSDCTPCTKTQARLHVLDRPGGTWPTDSPPAQEEPESVALDEPEPASEAAEAKPVGYSCKACGGILRDTGNAVTCNDCRQRWPFRETAKPPWVQPGPLEGPWQTHKTEAGELLEWTGEFRAPKNGEWYTGEIGTGGKAALCGSAWQSNGEPRHILRPIAQEAKEEDWPAEGKWLHKRACFLLHYADPDVKDATWHSRSTGEQVDAKTNHSYAVRIADGWTPIAAADLPWNKAQPVCRECGKEIASENRAEAREDDGTYWCGLCHLAECGRIEAEKAKPGEQCKGCIRLSKRVDAGKGCTANGKPWMIIDANPTNDCEHYQPREGESTCADDQVPQYATADLTPTRKRSEPLPGASGPCISRHNTYTTMSMGGQVVAKWDRVLSQEEVASLMRDPWQLWKPATPNPEEQPMPDTPKRSIPIRILKGLGKGVVFTILANLGAVAVLALLFTNELIGPSMRSGTLDLLAKGFAWVSPAWDATVAFLSRNWIGGALAGGGVLIGRYAVKPRRAKGTGPR